MSTLIALFDTPTAKSGAQFVIDTPPRPHTIGDDCGGHTATVCSWRNSQPIHFYVIFITRNIHLELRTHGTGPRDSSVCWCSNMASILLCLTVASLDSSSHLYGNETISRLKVNSHHSRISFAVHIHIYTTNTLTSELTDIE